MKKVTRITTLEITEIYDIPDEAEDAEVAGWREPKEHHHLAEVLTKILDVDNVKVINLQSFVNEKGGSNG